MVGCTHQWVGPSIKEAWQFWWNGYRTEKQKSVPLIMAWGIWLARNHAIFRNVDTPFHIIAHNVPAIYALLPEQKSPTKKRVNTPEKIQGDIP